MDGAPSSDRLISNLSLQDLFQDLSLGSDTSQVSRNPIKSSLQQLPYGSSSYGNERMSNNLLNGLDSVNSYPWGYYPSGNYQDPTFGYGNNSNTHLMNPHSSSSFDGFGYNDHLYGLYGNVIDSGNAYGTFGYDSWKLGRGWYPVDDGYRKTRSFSYGSKEERTDRLNELCRGPRTNDIKNQDDLNRYNGDKFPETLTKAKFFVIKSYSEDDVHNSIKYGVWSSTPTGNKKLDAAYHENSPVYLLFSVNASGQFVGIAEMKGSVDYNKTMECWQQDKWIGCFPVAWHIVKDVPNSVLRHITIESNENKPVTNSRDTQEVNVENGMKIVKIFKEYVRKTCILDDFKFYEMRQKIIRDKKIKQKKQVFEGVCSVEKTLL